jgi:hypothetical protein
MKCTWEGCQKEADQERLAGDGSVWANLCKDHTKQMDAAETSSDVKLLLSCWVRAQGGAKKAASRL